MWLIDGTFLPILTIRWVTAFLSTLCSSFDCCCFNLLYFMAFFCLYVFHEFNCMLIKGTLHMKWLRTFWQKFVLLIFAICSIPLLWMLMKLQWDKRVEEQAWRQQLPSCAPLNKSSHFLTHLLAFRFWNHFSYLLPPTHLPLLQKYFFCTCLAAFVQLLLFRSTPVRVVTVCLLWQ